MTTNAFLFLCAPWKPRKLVAQKIARDLFSVYAFLLPRPTNARQRRDVWSVSVDTIRVLCTEAGYLQTSKCICSPFKLSGCWLASFASRGTELPSFETIPGWSFPSKLDRGSLIFFVSPRLNTLRHGNAQNYPRRGRNFARRYGSRLDCALDRSPARDKLMHAG